MIRVNILLQSCWLFGTLFFFVVISPDIPPTRRTMPTRFGLFFPVKCCKKKKALLHDVFLLFHHQFFRSLSFVMFLDSNIEFNVFLSVNHPRKIVGNSGVSSQTGKEGQKHSKPQNIFCYGLKMNEIASVLS